MYIYTCKYVYSADHRYNSTQSPLFNCKYKRRALSVNIWRYIGIIINNNNKIRYGNYLQTWVKEEAELIEYFTHLRLRGEKII